jgi:hypothetical protein
MLTIQRPNDLTSVPHMLKSLRTESAQRVHPERLNLRFRDDSPMVQKAILESSRGTSILESMESASQRFTKMIRSVSFNQFCVSSSSKTCLDLITAEELPNLIEKLALLQFALSIFRFPETAHRVLPELSSREQRAVIVAALSFGIREADFANQANEIIAGCLAEPVSYLKLPTAVGLTSLAEAAGDLPSGSICALRNMMSLRVEKHFARLLSCKSERESLNETTSSLKNWRSGSSIILYETIKSHYRLVHPRNAV